MTGQVKEQVLTRFGELGVDVRDGCLRLEPRLLLRSELDTPPVRFRFVDVLDQDRAIDVPAGCLAFTYCQVPVVIRAGIASSIELEGADGQTTSVPGNRLDKEASAAIFSRSGTYRRLTVTVRTELLHTACRPPGSPDQPLVDRTLRTTRKCESPNVCSGVCSAVYSARRSTGPSRRCRDVMLSNPG